MNTPVVYAPPAAALRKKYIKIFKKENAVSSDKAINPEAHGMRQSGIFNTLVKQRVLIRAAPDAFYLDTEREKEISNRIKQSGIAVVICMFIILTVIIIIVLTSQHAKTIAHSLKNAATMWGCQPQCFMQLQFGLPAGMQASGRFVSFCIKAKRKGNAQTNE